MRERDPINDISVGEGVLFEVELGHRVFRCMSAENNNHHRYVQGISDLFFLTDTSDDWSDLHWMIVDDRRYDFPLEHGVAMIVSHMEDKDAAIRVLEAWEKQEPIDWWYEEWLRSYEWEEWVISGGLDDEP